MGNRKGVLARRVAVAALVVLVLQLALGIALQLWFSGSMRRELVVELMSTVDDMGTLDECTARPGPWVHREGWWLAWPVDLDGRVVGTNAPVTTVSLPAPRALAPVEVGDDAYAAVVYGTDASGCGGLFVARQERFPYFVGLSDELMRLGLVRLAVLLLAAIALVAVTAWPLVRRIRSLAAQVTAVVDADFEGEVRSESSDELGVLADAFDAAARTARERLARLEHRDAVLRRSLADLAHDLRTPLATLQLSASGLPNGDASSAIRAELSFLAGLTQNFEALLGHDESEELERLELDTLVERLRHRFTPTAADRGLAFDAALPDETPVVLAESIALERAISNLVHNALRWASGHVVLLLWIEGEHARIEVRDDGPGLGDLATYATERGVRGSQARGEGFGLGLAIAEAAARRFGGRLELANGPEGGTHAAMVLPLHEG